ncbi:MAG: VWA domain-containing protein [Anaerolineae bacterium]|nr:VWA domain-containing protein [Candidatus Roseilinea sp.]MDW8451232.1 VWA domain-containing protein [Anaerolineae bacterium]
MSFIWPAMLLSLLALLPVVALYVRAQARRRQMIARYGSLGFVQQSSGRRLGARRHVPAAFMFAGLATLAIALARPQAVLSLPRAQGTVVLAFDVSGSMAAEDIPPTRMEAAKAAARAFVQRQPRTVQIGVVAFSDSGMMVLPPTDDQQAVLAAINRLSPARGTSLANGIFAALTTIDDLGKKEATNYYSNREPQPTPTPTPMPPGVYQPAVIVLLTDGENTVPPDPIAATEAAVYRGVRIHTVGVGSPEGALLKIEGFTVHTRLDEPLLQYISERTGGVYYNAQTEDDLRAIYDSIGSQLIVEPEETEITAIFAGLGVILMLIGGVLSLAWFNRLP